jgi:hypothetical protein
MDGDMAHVQKLIPAQALSDQGIFAPNHTRVRILKKRFFGCIARA